MNPKMFYGSYTLIRIIVVHYRVYGPNFRVQGTHVLQNRHRLGNWISLRLSRKFERRAFIKKGTLFGVKKVKPRTGFSNLES